MSSKNEISDEDLKALAQVFMSLGSKEIITALGRSLNYTARHFKGINDVSRQHYNQLEKKDEFNNIKDAFAHVSQPVRQKLWEKLEEIRDEK